MPTKMSKRTDRPATPCQSTGKRKGPPSSSDDATSSSARNSEDDGGFIQKLQKQNVPRYIIERIVGRPVPPRIRIVSAQEAKRIKLMRGEMSSCSTPASIINTAISVGASPEKSLKSEDEKNEFVQKLLTWRHISHSLVVSSVRKSFRTSTARSVMHNRRVNGTGWVWDGIDEFLKRVQQMGEDVIVAWEDVEDFILMSPLFLAAASDDVDDDDDNDGNDTCKKQRYPFSQSPGPKEIVWSESNGTYITRLPSGSYEATICFEGKLRFVGTVSYRENISWTIGYFFSGEEALQACRISREIMNKASQHISIASAKEFALDAIRRISKKHYYSCNTDNMMTGSSTMMMQQMNPSGQNVTMMMMQQQPQNMQQGMPSTCNTMTQNMPNMQQSNNQMGNMAVNSQGFPVQMSASSGGAGDFGVMNINTNQPQQQQQFNQTYQMQNLPQPSPMGGQGGPMGGQAPMGGGSQDQFASFTPWR